MRGCRVQSGLVGRPGGCSYQECGKLHNPPAQAEQSPKSTVRVAGFSTLQTTLIFRPRIAGNEEGHRTVFGSGRSPGRISIPHDQRYGTETSKYIESQTEANDTAARRVLKLDCATLISSCGVLRC